MPKEPTIPDMPLRGMRFAVAGPGRVGTSLARWAADAGAELSLIVRRAASSGTSFSTSLPSPQGVQEMSFDELGQARESAFRVQPPLDALLLTVSDHALAEVAQSLAVSWRIAPASEPLFGAVLHSSGSLDAEVLAPLRGVGLAVGSLHPLRAFPDALPEPGPRPFFAVDGDPRAVAAARRFVAAWGGTACELSGERRVVYHLAASLAAGGVVTTLAAVTELMRRAELPDEVLGGYLGLLRGAVDAAEQVAVREGPDALASAITGPAARSDQATLARHRAALQEICPELAPTVEALWRETLRQSTTRRHSDTSRQSETARQSGTSRQT